MKQRSTIGLILLAGIMVLALNTTAASNSEQPQAPEQSYLYKATFVRAAPGKLLDLITLYKNHMTAYDAAGDERPFWWRHTQGDQWDLMLLFPMQSYEEYYTPKRVAKRSNAWGGSSLPAGKFQGEFQSCAAWHEDLFVMGPPLAKVIEEFDGSAYFHIEIFVALPGKHEELLKERVMENIYQTGIGRPWNMIFIKDQGAAWDLFTLGCYRDLQHWASSYAGSNEQREAAARKAGFEGPDAIGPYMRTLIFMHRDTMGVAIK
ncbi:MAG: hypothetical protein WBB73_05030 [Candidatus Aminicenantaceae bacterium]